MPRIFLCLVFSNLLLLAIEAIMGLLSGGSAPDAHIILGVLTLLFTCFLQVLVFTYFTITGKMMGQMLLMGHADLAPLRSAKRLKTLLTRLLAGLVIVAVFASASGAMRWRGYGPARLHLGAAALAVLAHAWILFRQYALVAENAAAFASVLRDHSAKRPASTPRVSRH